MKETVSNVSFSTLQKKHYQFSLNYFQYTDELYFTSTAISTSLKTMEKSILATASDKKTKEARKKGRKKEQENHLKINIVQALAINSSTNENS